MNEIKKNFSKLFKKEKRTVYDFDLLDFFEQCIYPNEMPNEKLKPLYRYSPADYYNIRSLETKKIHLSKIGLMNDVFEGLSRKTTGDKFEELYDLVYIKSFSENCNDLSMWSRYADNYSGMCVEYDVRKLSKDVLCHLYPVNYSDKRSINGNLSTVCKELIQTKQNIENGDAIEDFGCLKDIMGLYLSKSRVWMNENEWRLIFSYLQLNANFDEVEDDDQKEKILYEFTSEDIKFDCATKIYLGPKMEKVKKEHLKDIGRALGIDVIELQLSENEYKLKPKK